MTTATTTATATAAKKDRSRVPAPIRNYVSRNIPYPVALVGCRATGDHLDCCEYDLAVFAPEGGTSRVVEVSGYKLELVYFRSAKGHAADLGGMVILQDSKNLLLSSVLQEFSAGDASSNNTIANALPYAAAATAADYGSRATASSGGKGSGGRRKAAKSRRRGVGSGGTIADSYARALAAHGRKSLVSSLFCQQKMVSSIDRNNDANSDHNNNNNSSNNNPVIAAMWLKIAAYKFVEGAIALSGRRPMPLHELGQAARQKAGAGAEAPAALRDGTQAALEAIGIERATRPAIARSMAALAELKSREYDRELVMSKADYLLGKSMLSDCYYYIGRAGASSLAGRGDSFYTKYTKLIQIAMDLSSDVQQMQKLQKILFRATTTRLKS